MKSQTKIHFQFSKYLSRLVELTRLTIETKWVEKEKYETEGKIDPDRMIKMPSESKGGVMEVYIKVI